MGWIKNWFSNFEPFETPVEYQGIAFRTPEHMYQALKLPKSDVEGRRRIAEAATPGQAKRMGRSCNLRSDWETVKVDVMRFVLKRKFAKGTTWLSRLLRTNGEIVEVNNWHDNIWGSCKCEKCGNRGQNLLGKLLMEIRARERFAASLRAKVVVG